MAAKVKEGLEIQQGQAIQKFYDAADSEEYKGMTPSEVLYQMMSRKTALSKCVEWDVGSGWRTRPGVLSRGLPSSI